MSVQEKFDAAVAEVRDPNTKLGKSVPSERKLILYKYYKQATDGDIPPDLSAPWAVQLEAKAKYDAWKSVKGVSKDDAKLAYVEEWEKQKSDFA